MTSLQATDVVVVVPVGNSSRMAGDVVASLLATSPPPGEIIVVDDRVRDDSLRTIPADPRVRIVRHTGPPGPAAARNTGAKASSKPIILFCDSDVFVPADFFNRLVKAYESGADAVLGVEAELPTLPHPASRYKNLWMRYTYVRLDRRVNLFYTSCASIKREVFLSAGGFDEGYSYPSVEDTAFGWTLGNRGVNVILDKTLAVEHRKTYNTRGVIRTAYKRGCALARCVSRMGAGGKNRSSVPTSLIVSLAFVAAAPAAAAVIIWSVPAGLAATAVCLAAVYTLNAPWLSYVGQRGPAMLAYAVAVLPAELAASLSGGVWGVLSYHLLNKRY